MNRRTKEKLKTVVRAGVVSLALGSVMALNYLSKTRGEAKRFQQEAALRQTQEDINAVESYMNAIDNPEGFDGWYTLGWSMPVPKRYEEFIETYQASRQNRTNSLP